MGFKVALDIGVASVGWAVVDDNYEVIDAGVRLFSSADSSQNIERREKRGTKRIQRRKVHRLVRFDRVWRNIKLEMSSSYKFSPLELRNKGISKKLEEDEIYVVLRNMLKHRGISYMEDALEENAKGNYQKALQYNQEHLVSKFPCEIQLERMNKYGKYRGDDIVNEEGEMVYLSNVFTIGGYKKELERFFEVQREYHSFIDDEFIKEYMDLFSMKRKYYDGPGNEKSRTDYGKYTTKVDPVSGEYITDENLFEKLIGKCSVYKDELRGSRASYTAQEFNLLNDLNNLTINGRKLEEGEKRTIVESVKNASRINMRTIIKNAIGENIEDLQGARVDSSDKEIFHTFETYRELKKVFASIDCEIEKFSREELDELGHILTINTDKESIVTALKVSKIILSPEESDVLVEVRKKRGTLFSKWHSFSLAIMYELMEELYKRPVNQMVLLTEMGVFKPKVEFYKGMRKIPTNIILEELYNPIVRKSVKQSINVLNEIIRVYGYPTDIVIEMPRDKNEEEQKREIKKVQENNEKEISTILKKIKEEYGITVTEEHFYQHKALKTKLRLWNEQQGKCLYSGKPIEISQLLNDKQMFEIDHIIPISVSFDDSRGNKVLVYRSENQLKGNRTPFMYLSGIDRSWNFEQYSVFVNELEKKKLISGNKKRNLLFRESITKQDVLKGFIQRNLNDTRYASKVVLNSVQDFMNANDHNVKIKVVRGSFTSQFRHRLELDKNRDESFAHHAVDAMIMCYSQMGFDAYKLAQKEIIDFETGEILDQKAYETMDDEKLYERYMFYQKLMEIRVEISKAEKRVKYSHKVDKKVNRKLSNETIYGTRIKADGTNQKISKISNIYDDAGYESFMKKITTGKNGKDKKEDFLMYHQDPKTFEILLKINEQFSDQKNPFKAYLEEQGEPIRKYSKKNNGPYITSLKYYDGEVNSCIDISHKYGYEKNSRKVILDSLDPFRTDVYFRKSDQTYHLAGIKYANFKYKAGEYILDEESYNQILIEEKILEAGKTYYELKDFDYEFLFSLYKNDILKYEKNGEIYIERFLSRTLPSKKNYIETKPIEANKFEKRHLVGLSNTRSMVKINTDILGNQHFCKKENFQIKFNLD